MYSALIQPFHRISINLFSKSAPFLVLISHGYAEISAHARMNLCYLIYLRHLIRSRAVTNRIYLLRKYTFACNLRLSSCFSGGFFIRVLSYHVIWVLLDFYWLFLFVQETPSWAVYGSNERGFDPLEKRYFFFWVKVYWILILKGALFL